jgi:hypothetical protein
MSLNQKMTRVVKGRVIEDLQMNPSEVAFAILGRLDYASEGYGIE